MFCFAIYLIIFYYISPDVYNWIWPKCYVFRFVNYFQIFHNVFQFILKNILKHISQIMLWNSISQYFTKCCTQMSNISRHMFISQAPPWSLCFVRALFRTAIQVARLAAFLPMSALASSSGQFLGSLHSAQLLRVTVVTSFQCSSRVWPLR